MLPDDALYPRRALPTPAVSILALVLLTAVRPGAPPALAAEPPAANAAGSGAVSNAEDFIANREEIFNAFYRTGLDTGTPYAVTDLAVRKDNMTLLLKRGTLFLMKPIAGEVTGAVFIGEGVASMTPPNRTERFMLEKNSGKESLNEKFSEAVFRFSDGTEKTLLASARPDPSGAARAEQATKLLRERNSWLNGTRALSFEMQFLENRISGLVGEDFFVADLNTPEHDWLLYTHNPQEIIENELSTTRVLSGDRRYMVIWNEWHNSDDYGPEGHYLLNPDHDGPRLIAIRDSELQLNLPNTKMVEWDAKVRVEVQEVGLRALGFDLVNNADFSSRWYEDDFYPVNLLAVEDDQHRKLEFMHKKDRLIVILPDMAPVGTTLTLHFKGTAQIVYQLTAESFGLVQTAWYPQYGLLGGRSSFHWTVRVPRPYLISGSGKVLRRFEDKETRQNGLEFICDEPASLPWVIFGKFKLYEDKYTGTDPARDVALSIHSFPTMTTTITDASTLSAFGLRAPITLTLQAPVKKIKGLFEEGKEILKVYEHLYGPYPYDELHIAQMGPQMAFGQAPQGFVQLWGMAFMTQAEASEYIQRGRSDFVHGLLSHEFAHQWWFHQVGMATRDDEWISESFAEYASGIFIKEYQGEDRFQDQLQEWRQNAKQGDPEAPIAAANTLRGPNSGDYRRYLLYNKGPYVLHMLRIQLGDEKYVEVMRSIQKTYKNRDISTEMLLAEVNRVTGQNFTWFFDQWVWDVGIPRFHYSWQTEKQPDGKFLIKVHVTQEDKKHVKKVLMPVHIHFGKKVIPQYKPILDADETIKILSPQKPTDVTLDDDRSLLADIIRAD